MLNKIKLSFITLCVVTFTPIYAIAGWANGPYVVWINYDNKTPDNMNAIAKTLFNENDSCIDITRDPIFYMRNRPKKITNELVYKALIGKNIKAQADLYNALISFKDKSIWDPNETIEGLDGVIAYFPTPKPRFMSFSFNSYTRKYKIKTKYVKRVDDKSFVRDALCEVMPDITRS